MAAEKLYYQDSHQKDFEGQVADCRKSGEQFIITLNKTAFYPEGGGQPGDRGMLGNVRVLDTQEQEGEVLHICDGPLEPGSTVEGHIDWERRFDLMQQHSGEHMVSGVAYRKYGCHNVGFHMGEDYITIDFDRVIPSEALEEIEKEVNGFIWQNLPLRCYVPSKEELPQVTYRRKRDLPWPVRIVEIPGVDSCACCGVQVKATGEIGLVKLFSSVKFHQGVRIEMAAGSRALRLLNESYDQNRQVSRCLSAKLPETGAAAQAVLQQLAQEKFRGVGLWKRLTEQMARSYEKKENPVLLEEGLTPLQVRELADAVARRCGGAATVLSGSDEEGYSICIVGADAGADVRPVGQAAAEALGGRGGGKPGAYQGRLKTTRQEIIRYYGLT